MKINKLYIKKTKERASEVDSLSLKFDVGIKDNYFKGLNNFRQVLIAINTKPGKFQENINLDAEEDLISGSLLYIDKSIIRLTVPFLHENAHIGFYGIVLNGGEITSDSTIKLENDMYENIPTSRYERFLWLINKVPYSKVITYGQLLNLLDLKETDTNIIDEFIKKTSTDEYPTFRIVDWKGGIFDDKKQKKILKEEGVIISGNLVDLEKSDWDTSELFE